MDPLVSIIIPTYNRASLLKEALESVFLQSYSHYEVLVVDDGSEDNTQEVAFSFSCRYVQLEHNGCPGFVRNRGVEQSRGEWIAFLDSDDLWETDKLEQQVRYLSENPECSILHTRERWLRAGKVISQSKLRHKRQGDIFKDALGKCIIGPSTVMMKKSLFLALGGFREDLEIAEDYELWLRICDRQKVGYIDEPLITKRAGGWPQLSEKYGQIEKFRIVGLKDLVDKAVFAPQHHKEAKEVLAEKCRIYSKGAFKRGRVQEGNKYEALALLYSQESSS